MLERDWLLAWADCLMEARSQYLQAGEMDQARNVTNRLSGVLTRSGFYDGVRALNFELLQYEEHPSPMIWIARTYLEQGNFSDAGFWYQRCKDLAAACSNQIEMASALHGLARIDLRKGLF